MGLKFSYTLLAPIYDVIVASPTQSVRQSSLKRLADIKPQNILINGIGTGLDIPYLPDQHIYTATDLTPAMLDICTNQLDKSSLNMKLHTADVMRLPFDDNTFDIIVMHLILAVVSEPDVALKEAARVLKPGGKIFILDKFIQPGQLAPVRRFLNIFVRHIATRTDVVFEKLLDTCPQLELIENIPSLFGGWFRLITLVKLK